MTTFDRHDHYLSAILTIPSWCKWLYTASANCIHSTACPTHVKCGSVYSGVRCAWAECLDWLKHRGTIVTIFTSIDLSTEFLSCTTGYTVKMRGNILRDVKLSSIWSEYLTCNSWICITSMATFIWCASIETFTCMSMPWFAWESSTALLLWLAEFVLVNALTEIASRTWVAIECNNSLSILVHSMHFS